jgi:glycosyltransferase involved in cell wall biosynthesis
MLNVDQSQRRQRLLVFIVAYNAEKTIEHVLRRMPTSLRQYDTEILIIDDASQDATFETSEAVRRAGDLPFKLTVLANPVNQGYGGNQKLGFLYAIEQGFDVVALIHGDGQYAPEALPHLVQPLMSGEADVVMGSRMLQRGAALRGGMPRYKYVGNKILTAFQNRMLRTNLSEFHSGYRLYTTAALRQIPFQLNANGFHFDTEIIIQLLLAGLRIKELPIPTYYGDEICYVNGIQYAMDVVRATTAARLQAYNLVYRRAFDVRSDSRHNDYYTPKFDFDSPHSAALSEIAPGQTVLDLGCAAGYLATALKAKGCRVIGVDRYPPAAWATFDEFIQHDLDSPEFPRALDAVDVVLMLDVIEHLRSPEAFLAALHEAAAHTPRLKIVISTGNVGFIVPRFMLLVGHFNYGKRGILDLTHTRLFTFRSLRRLLEESGFELVSERGIPAPIPLVARDDHLAGTLMRLNRLLIRLSRTLFSYQIFAVVRPLPSLEAILEHARTHSTERAAGVARHDQVALGAAGEGRVVVEGPTSPA